MARLAWLFVAASASVASGFRAPVVALAPPLRARSALFASGVEEGGGGAAADDDGTEGSSSSLGARRTVVAGLASVGVAETAYLSYSKVAAAPVLCASKACGGVLSSPYAYVGGIPLVFFGLAAYAAVAGLAAAPLVSKNLEARTRAPLLLATSAMAAFSCCLVLLLVFKLKEFCAVCAGSACLSLANAALLRDLKLGGGADFPAPPRLAGAGAAALFAAVALFGAETDVALREARAIVAAAPPAVAAPEPAPGKNRGPVVFSPPDVTTETTPQAARLAAHLKRKGAKMYGAYWCSHCFNQKEQFGRVAVKDVDYYECANDGYNSRRDACQAKDIKGYPTWEIDGALYPGEKTLDELAELSGFVDR